MTALSAEPRAALEEVYARVDARSTDIGAAHAWWPCRRGCDHCCRNLAAPLPITEPEWRYLQEGLRQLPDEALADVRARLAELPSSRPYPCPLLDRASGACRVYAHRPLACRAYGFAHARDGGRWCHLISALLDRHGDGDIVWANQDALERTVAALGGPTLLLPDWFSKQDTGA